MDNLDLSLNLLHNMCEIYNQNNVDIEQQIYLLFKFIEQQIYNNKNFEHCCYTIQFQGRLKYKGC